MNKKASKVNSSPDKVNEENTKKGIINFLKANDPAMRAEFEANVDTLFSNIDIMNVASFLKDRGFKLNDPSWRDLRESFVVEDGLPDLHTLGILNEAIINYFNKPLCEGFTIEESKQFHCYNYPFTSYSVNNDVTFISIHRLVALAAHGYPPADKPNACHRNDIKLDNRSENVYWGSQSDNKMDLYRNNPLVKVKIKKTITGHKHTEDAKRNMSLANSGENNGFYGKTHSAETRDKISAANTGENHPFYGKKQSPEHISKRVESRKRTMYIRKMTQEIESGKVCYG